MPVVKTRFAPSPSGYLHIGGARTALFAWAFAKKHGGQFFLRIEDTDAARSTQQHSQAIIDALEWLGITPDAKPVYQSQRVDAHRTAIAQLLDAGHAYHCYCTPEELDAMRAAQTACGETPRYDRRWRDATTPPPAGVPPVVRFKMPLDGQTTFTDKIKGELQIANAELDDFIIARADGMPTYNLAAVVDDIHMGISHIIRGDDHIMNTYRQWHVFAALLAGTPPPQFAHLPMILTAAVDDDGTPQMDDAGNPRYVRMSKRHAAVDIQHYRQQGFLPEALCNYLARLSWAAGDLEIFPRETFVQQFALENIGNAPARFDLDKLRWVNREHLQTISGDAICQQTQLDLSDAVINLFRPRAHTLQELKSAASYFVTPPVVNQNLLAEHLQDDNTKKAFDDFCARLSSLSDWQAASIKKTIKEVVHEHSLPFKAIGMPLRIVLTGQTDTPDIAAIAALLTRSETLRRLTILD